MYRDDKKKSLPGGTREEPRKTQLSRKGLAASAISALLLALGTAWLRGIFEQATVKGVILVLSDSFLIPGAVFLAVAGLSWIATFGMFDIMSFGCSSLFGRFIPFDSVYRRQESYYDYKVKKDEKGRVWKLDMLLIGGIFFLLSVVMTVVYSAI